jgi:ketosteroid isomerase-like protein/hydrogenase/urease accessory protein HupE
MTPRRSPLLLSALSLLLLPLLAVAHGITEADQQAMVAGGNLRYLVLGASHMLTGYDHLLFLFGVIYFIRTVRETVKYVTAFTLGHSITLVFATVYGLTANYYLVDALIALSVCYKGFENLDGFNRYLGRPSPSLLPVIFGFGLIHGFGLSTRLQQLPLGEDGIVPRILAFNVGVELGQIVALSVMVAVLAGWRRTLSFGRFTSLSNRALVAAGLALFLVQMHGLGHSLNLSGFGFSAARAQSTTGAAAPVELERALTAYDRAFEGRDVLALWELFAEDIILVEQGTQNVGREDALGKHLGPDLQAFQQLSAEYTDVRVQQVSGAAIRTRRFAVKGKLPNRFFHARGYETQNWALRDGGWKLVHMHWSFP